MINDEFKATDIKAQARFENNKLVIQADDSVILVGYPKQISEAEEKLLTMKASEEKLLAMKN